MGLFDQLLNAVNDPNQQANPDQLSSILGSVQQVAQTQGIDPATTNTVMSVVGNYVRSSLQQQQAIGGDQQVQSLVNQFAGGAPSMQAVQALLGPNQEQLVKEVCQRTGLNPSMVQGLLPMVIPVILNLLQSGNNTQNPQGGNSVLNAFLDTDSNGNVDIGDAMGLMSRFLNQPR